MEEKKIQWDRNVKLLTKELRIAKDVSAKKAVCISLLVIFVHEDNSLLYVTNSLAERVE